MTDSPPTVTIVDEPPYARVPEALLFDPKMTDAAVRVYGVLLRHGKGPNQCYPSHRRIALLTGKAERSINRIVSELEEAGWIRRVQRGVNKSCSYVVYNTLPLAQPCASTPTPTAHQSAVTTAHQSAGNESNPNESKRQPPVSPPTVALVQDFFDQFWTTYPRREAKGAARKAWDKATTRALPEVVIAGAARYRDDPNREPSFTAHPATWLNQDRWTDEPLPPRRSAIQAQPLNRGGRLGEALRRFEGSRS